LGLTGVGKTELAKSLAEHWFDSEKMLVCFDMLEYVGVSYVLHLTGAPPRFEYILFSTFIIIHFFIMNLNIYFNYDIV
jgi:GTPase SAR1 family protein